MSIKTTSHFRDVIAHVTYSGFQYSFLRILTAMVRPTIRYMELDISNLLKIWHLVAIILIIVSPEATHRVV